MTVNATRIPSLVARVAAGALVLAALLAAPARAQDDTTAPRTLRVGLYESPPFVMKDGDHYTGMAFELWREMAASVSVRSEFQEYPTLRELVEATAVGEVDVAVTNLTITSGRAERLDFTQPWFDAGLRIMVDDDRNVGFTELVAGLAASGHLAAYGWLAFVILLATVILTAFDRHFDKDFPKRWRDGVAESFYTVMSVATSGRPPSRKNLFGWVGRIWQGLWLVCGIAVLAYVTSSVTSVMTTLSLTNQINSLADLSGRTVGVFTGSVAEQFAASQGLSRRSYANIDAAVEALVAGRIAAIVGDAPVLEYYAHTHPEQSVSVVGAIFEPDKYGFGLARQSPLTRPLTVEILGAHESDLVEQLRTKYFGDKS